MSIYKRTIVKLTFKNEQTLLFQVLIINILTSGEISLRPFNSTAFQQVMSCHNLFYFILSTNTQTNSLVHREGARLGLLMSSK